MQDELERIRQLAVTGAADPELLEALGDNAERWAAAFCSVAKQHGYVIDEWWMIGWFANAIEHSHEVRTKLAEDRE